MKFMVEHNESSGFGLLVGYVDFFYFIDLAVGKRTLSIKFYT